MKAIIGLKKQMSQVFRSDGSVVPVTLVQAGPCTVTESKTLERDHYQAVQLGFGTSKKVAKPQRQIWAGLGSFRVVREFRVEDSDLPKRGDVVNVSIFAPGDRVDVIGLSKGRGFQGVVKRHGFAGGPASHGHKDNLRMPGSIGAGGVQRVIKGLRMAGRMGGERVTVKNLEVVEVYPDKNLMAIKGAVPGAFGGLIFIQGRTGRTLWQK